jgi:hypothetical protein
MCPKLYPNLQVLCFVDMLSPRERRRLPAVIPYSWSIDKVRRVATRKPVRWVAREQVAA